MLKYMLLTAILFNCFLAYKVVAKSNRSTVFLVLISASYWFLNYFLHPVLFIISNSLNIATSINEVRIDPNSAQFNELLAQIVLGTLVFCTTLYLFLRKSPNSVDKFKSEISPKKEFYIINLGILASMTSLIIENTDLQNPVTKALAPSASTFYSVFLWKKDSVIKSKAQKYVTHVLGIFSLLITSSSLGNAKGVLLLPAAILMYRMLTLLPQQSRLLKSIIALPLMIFGVAIFNLLQTRKLGQVVILQNTRYGDTLPWNLGFFLPVSQRFDQFPRLVDANIAGVGTLGGYYEWLVYFIRSFIWNPTTGRVERSFGQLWNSEVTNLSIKNAIKSDVSFAPGMIAESYIWGGLYSLIIGCSVMAVVFIMVANLLERGILFAILGMGIIGNGTLFEAGVISFGYKLTESFKIFLFTWIISLFLYSQKRYKSG